MEPEKEGTDSQLPIEERRLLLDEKRFLLDNSFARKWLPTLVTLMIGFIASLIGYVQQQNSIQATERARIEAQAKDEREWGFKVIEMYFAQRELFDLTKNPEQAASNLRILAAVAPTIVKGVLKAEQSKIPPPGKTDDKNRLKSLAAVAGVQEALANARPVRQDQSPGFQPSDFTIYVQYPDGGQKIAEKAQSFLENLKYHVSSIEQVHDVPHSLQVRYYRPDQRAYAEELAVKLAKELNVPIGENKASLVPSSKDLPSGILEVWLPSLQ